MPVTLECEYCGDEFEAYPYEADDRKFCSTECSNAGKDAPTGEDHPQWDGGLKTVECDNCGDELQRKPAVADDGRNFCDRECYHEFGRPDMQGENNPQHKEKATLQCEVCGDDFEVYQYRADDARFCSSECNRAYLRGRTGEDHPEWEGGQVEIECLTCGDIFTDYPSHSDREYCSEDCYREAAKELFAGENNPVWRGGYDGNYGPNWEEQREKVLERDGYTCQDCGTHADDMDRSPDIHHKKRLGWFKEEYDAPEWYRKANRVENLVTLCRPCHADREKLGESP